MSNAVADAAMMRFQLQKVAAYRELCRAVRRSGRENVIFAAIMIGFVSYMWPNASWTLLGIIVASELFVGLLKWVWPSAEGFLLDGFVLLMFSAYNLWYLFDGFQKRGQIGIGAAFLAAFMLNGAINRFKTYRQIGRLFAERPSSEHMAWFDELIREIRAADPQSDELALDLPTRPKWKAKLLGSNAFFVSVRGSAVWIAGPDDFEILREKVDGGTGLRRGFLRIYDRSYPEFDIDDATWANYLKWRSTNPTALSRDLGDA